jgi:ribonuclease
VVDRRASDDLPAASADPKEGAGDVDQGRRDVPESPDDPSLARSDGLSPSDHPGTDKDASLRSSLQVTRPEAVDQGSASVVDHGPGQGEADDAVPAKEFPIRSTWDGPVGDEPQVDGPAGNVDGVKDRAVPLKPHEGLQPGDYSSGKFTNRDGDLPTHSPDGTPITYREYDVKPYDGVWRGGERVVVGSDGTHYSTSNHYDDFRRFR